jgi:3-hydroxybutyryl-CoA dehydrogenase
MEIKNIIVCGAGTMGAGIAQIFAQNGFGVCLYDINQVAIDTGKASIERNLKKSVAKGYIDQATADKTLLSILFTTDLRTVKAELVIEAIVEKAEVKQSLFKELASLLSTETIFASNTSSLSISALSASIPNSARVVGMHFFNPAHIMKLVEIVQGASTDETVIDRLKELCVKIGKTPVVCKDSPGFIVNRVARHFYVESLLLSEERVSTIENIDSLIESVGFKMGPFKLMDVIGNDINFAVTKSMYDAFHGANKFRPSRVQEQKVLSGHLGIKSGQGFYIYKEQN